MKEVKRFCVAVLAVIAIGCAKTQSDDEAPTETMSYATKNGKVQRTVARSEYYVIGAVAEMRKMQAKEGTNYRYLTPSTAILQVKSQIGTYPIREKYLKEKYPKLRIEPVLIPADGSRRLLLKGGVKLKLSEGTTMPQEVKELQFSIPEKVDEEGVYELTSNYHTSKVFEIVTQLQKVKGIEFAAPDFTDNRTPYKD